MCFFFSFLELLQLCQTLSPWSIPFHYSRLTFYPINSLLLLTLL
jgi:hypothetical protein